MTKPRPAEIRERAVLQLRVGQLVVRIADDELLKIVEVDTEGCRLEDGSAVGRDEVEDPLRASYRWDLERSRRANALRQAVERRDFQYAFPGVAELRRERARRPRVSLAVLGWLLALAEGVALTALLAG